MSLTTERAARSGQHSSVLGLVLALLLLLAAAAPAQAAATFRASAAGGNTAGSNPAVTITPAVNDLMVVFVCSSGNTNTIPTMTDNNGSGTYSLVAAARKNTSADTLSVFVRDVLVPNTTSTTITAAVGTNTAAEAVVVAVAGMSRVGGLAARQYAVQQNQAAAATPAPTFPKAVLTGLMTIGAVCNGSNPATLTPPASWTEQQDVGQATPNTGLEVVTRDSGFTGTTVTWGGTSATAFASAVLELDDTSAGATAAPSLVQAIGSASTQGISASGLQMWLPNNTGSGNAVTLCLSSDVTATGATVTDDQSNVWLPGPFSRTAGYNQIFYALDVAANTRKITATFTGASAALPRHSRRSGRTSTRRPRSSAGRVERVPVRSAGARSSPRRRTR